MQDKYQETKLSRICEFRAFSFVETLCVIAIIAVVAALLFPVIASSKESSKKVVCVSNLKQLFLDTTIYQADWDGTGRYGDMYSMGLPVDLEKNVPSAYQLFCPSLTFDNQKVIGKVYLRYFVPPEVDGTSPTWATYTNTYQDKSILWFDMNHNPADVPLNYGQYLSRLGLGINLGGSLVRKSSKGDWEIKTWWH